MKPRSRSFGPAATMAFALTLLLNLAPVHAGDEDSPAPEDPPAITLPAAGTRCRIDLKTETPSKGASIEVTYEGLVAETKDDGITLAVTEVRRVQSSGGIASKLPVLNRLFRNVGIARMKPGEEKSVWIPEASIRAITALSARE